MKTLQSMGVHVVAAAPPDDWAEKLRDEAIPFRALKRFKRKSANPIADLCLLYELYRLYRQVHPSAVLHFTIKANVYGTFAALLSGAKSICTVTGLGWLFTERSLKTVIGGFGYKILYRIAFSYAEHVILLNRDDREFFLKNRLVRPEKCVMMPGQGVNTGRFSPDGGSSPEGQARTTFLLIARMLWDKGIGEYVEAARITKETRHNVEFQLLGPIDSENRAAIPLKTIDEWHTNGIVRYLGKTADVRPYIEKSAAVVLPSYREGVPTVLLEAMAMAKPIITTDVPGCREVIEDGVNGFLVPPKDARALADSFIRFVDLSQDRRKEMGRDGREKAVNRFDEGIVTDAYLRLIQRAMVQ